jgi:thiol-disulfide isomerase/thioredoxin
VIVTPRRLIVVGVLLVAAAGVWAVVRARRADSAAAFSESGSAGGSAITVKFFREPSKVPSFTLHDLSGGTISSDSFRGKVTIINFWATWCGPCRAEIPDLVALQQKYSGQLQIIGISEDEVPAEEVKRFVVANRMNYPIAMTTPEIEKMFPGISALPTSYIVDREGRIVQRHQGMLNPTLTNAETRVLAGLPIDAKVELVDRIQKANLENGAHATSIPGVDLSRLTPEKRSTALERLNSEGCTCGCDLSLARCRIEDPNCGVSLPLAKKIAEQLR